MVRKFSTGYLPALMFAAAAAVAENAATSTPAATEAAEATKSNKPGRRPVFETKRFATREELNAFTPPKGYRRYVITVPAQAEEKTYFVASREPGKAFSAIAELNGVKSDNIDRKAGGRPSKTPEEIVAAMSETERAALFAKFMGNGSTAASAMNATPAATEKRSDTTDDFNKTAGGKPVAAGQNPGSPARKR